jgi:superfamily I DNA and/or RNA helicase
MLNK